MQEEEKPFGEMEGLRIVHFVLWHCADCVLLAQLFQIGWNILERLESPDMWMSFGLWWRFGCHLVIYASTATTSKADEGEVSSEAAQALQTFLTGH